MDQRDESGAVELSDLLTVWAKSWVKEKGASDIAWVEHTKAAADKGLKWKMGGHTKAQQYGLSLVISTEEAASASDTVCWVKAQSSLGTTQVLTI